MNAKDDKDVRVKVWRVVVNTSVRSNMGNVVGRYLTKSAAMRVAQAFRHEVYTDPYNYVADTADVRVTIDEDTTGVMSERRCRIAMEHGVKVEVVK